MAKKRQSKYSINKLSKFTPEDFKNFNSENIRDLNKEELKVFVLQAKKLADETKNDFNKSLKEANEKYGYFPTSDAYTEGSKTNYLFRRKNNINEITDINQLRDLARDYSYYFKLKTITFDAWDKRMHGFIEALEKRTGEKIEEKNYAEFFKIYGELANDDHASIINDSYRRYETWREIAKLVNGNNYKINYHTDNYRRKKALEIEAGIKSKELEGEFLPEATDNFFDFGSNKPKTLGVMENYDISSKRTKRKR